MPDARRMARIDGTLFETCRSAGESSAISTKADTSCVQQADVGDGIWEITEMSLSITGKILLFKSLSMMSDEVFSDFRRVPDDLTFAKAWSMLKEPEAAAPASSPTVARDAGPSPAWKAGAARRRQSTNFYVPARSVSFRTVNFSIRSALPGSPSPARR